MRIPRFQPAAEMADECGFSSSQKAAYQDHPADGSRAPVANISEHHGKLLALPERLGQYADANKNEHPMITDPSANSGLTRRSFIKRSVVAVVAVSSMTIFSGLVNATLPESTGSGTACVPGNPVPFTKKDTGTLVILDNGQNLWEYECEASGPPGCCQSSSVVCGKFSATGNAADLKDVQSFWLAAD
jgi:hypothetical protein